MKFYNYQIFISRLGLKFTTLLNLRTGASWLLIETKDGQLAWQAIFNEAPAPSTALPPPPVPEAFK